jgi:hypothetical protein
MSRAATSVEASESHTPGPWRVDPTHELCIESDHGNIGLVNLARHSAADARLIAAAPDLLVGAKAILAARDGKASMDAIIRLRDAIARAEGRDNG